MTVCCGKLSLFPELTKLAICPSLQKDFPNWPSQEATPRTCFSLPGRGNCSLAEGTCLASPARTGRVCELAPRVCLGELFTNSERWVWSFSFLHSRYVFERLEDRGTKQSWRVLLLFLFCVCGIKQRAASDSGGFGLNYCHHWF